jgi:hypothetical protein
MLAGRGNNRDQNHKRSRDHPVQEAPLMNAATTNAAARRPPGRPTLSSW